MYGVLKWSEHIPFFCIYCIYLSLNQELLQTLNELGNSSYEGLTVSVLRENMVAPLEAMLEEERKERELMKNQEVDLESISNTLLEFMKDLENQLNTIRAMFQRLPVPFKEVQNA